LIVPFVDLKKQYYSIKEDIDNVIQDVLENSAFIGGRYLKSFEESFARYIEVKQCIGVGNGTDALFVALSSLGIQQGDEVITTANSFIATSEAISRTRAKVVFVDCDEKTYNIDVTQIEKAITPKTKAIIPVHLYGQPADMDVILDIATTHQLFVIEDAAQSHGAEYKGKKVGSFGDCACYSFYPGKNLGAYGDGGAIVTNNEKLAQKMRMFVNHGRSDKYHHEFEAINSRLDGLQAAILEVKLNHLDSWTEQRRKIATIYDDGLKNILVTPAVLSDMQHVYHLYVVQIPNRDKVRESLSDKGISTGVHYPIPLPYLKAYNYLGHSSADFPVAFSVKDNILSLPISGDLTEEQAGYVVDQLKALL